MHLTLAAFLAKIDNGVTGWRKQGLRGSHIWKESLEEFKGGKVTIAVANYPMNNWDPTGYIPAVGPLSVWVEEKNFRSCETLGIS